MKPPRRILLLSASMVILHGAAAGLFAQSTAFTYQGCLNDGGIPASGAYDLTFTLYADATNAVVIAGPVTNSATSVSNGIFIASVDFGRVFTGSNYWLDIAVRTNGATSFSDLAPRQPITTVPYAVMAATAGNLLGPLPATQLNGVVPAQNLPATLVTNGQSAVVLTGRFFGIGAGLSLFPSQIPGLDASNIVSGTFADSLLSTNVPLLNASAQTWNAAGTNSFGAIVISSNTGAAVPLQIYTNRISSYGNNPMIQFGVAGYPALAQFTLNPNHGGLGDGSEFGISANQIAIVGTGLTGGRIQVGGQGLGAPWAISLQEVGFVSPFVPYTANGGIVDWKYGWWNGVNAVGQQMDLAISTVNTTTGQGTLTFYDPWQPVLDNDSPSNQAHRFDINGGVGTKSYGATMLDAISTTPSWTNYSINIGQAYQDVYVTSPLYVNITNVSILTNTAAGTATALATEVVFYGGLRANAITFAPDPTINLIWENDSGAAVAPTNLPASNVLHLHLLLGVSGSVTNCLASAKFGLYTPLISPLASNFLSAASITNAFLSNAITQFCAGLQVDGLLPKMIEFWPMAGDSGSGATNNLGLNGNNLVQYGTISNNANGMTFDGVTGYADTQLIPANIFASPSNACLVAYLRTGTGFYSSPAVMGALDYNANVYCGIGAVTIAPNNAILALGLNALSASDGDTVSSSLEGFVAVNRSDSVTQTIYCAGSSMTFYDVQAAGLGTHYSLFIGARNAEGSADHFFPGAIAGAGIFQNMTTADMANLQQLVIALNAALGRQ